MNEIIVTVTNDKKEKDDSFEATAAFQYSWNNSWNGYGGNMSLTAFGRTEEEARHRLTEELLRYQSQFVNALMVNIRNS